MGNNPFLQGAPVTNATPSQPAPTNMPMPGAGNKASENFEIDLTNVESQSFVIPDGIYRVKCTNVEQQVSKGGNPMFNWDFEIMDGDHKGFKTKLFTALTPAAMWKVAEIVQSLGIGQIGQTVKFKRSDVVGKECGANFIKTEYNGNERSQISRTMTIKEMMESIEK